jgi:hypothetical protein
VVVDDCVHEPNALPPRTVGLLGTYVIPSGGSEQLGYLQPPGEPEHATVAVDGEKLGFSFDYQHFAINTDPRGSAASFANLLIWYTDGAQRKLRWTCISYRRTGRLKSGGIQWGVQSTTYGSRAWPPGRP